MKRFLSAIALCTFLLGLGIFFMLPHAQAEDNIIMNLLNLPSPPPPNPLVKRSIKNRPESFYDTKNPPSDDASIEDIMDYWQRQSTNPNVGGNFGYTALGYKSEPSDKVVNRIYDELENNPEKVMDYINILPKNDETAQKIKRYYDKLKENNSNSENVDRDSDNYNADELKNWLTYNSSYFSDELLESAKDVKDQNGYIVNDEQLLALADVDWEKAKPILDRLANDSSQPVSQTLANWAFYKHALKEKNSIEADNYRKRLQDAVENKNLSAGNRDLAMDAIVDGGDFSGRDDWYLSLYDDETLFDMKGATGTFSGLMTMVMKNDPEKYKDKMLELLKSSNKNVRNAAVQNLVIILDKDHPDIVEALLPWLENKDWAKEMTQSRARIVQILSEIEVPNSVNGLLAVLNEKEKVKRPYYPNANAAANAVSAAVNTASRPANVASDVRTVETEEYPLRYAAIRALAKQKNPIAVSALRQLLPELEYYQTSEAIRAINACKGYSTVEQVDALVRVAKENSQREEIYANAANAANAAANRPVIDEVLPTEPPSNAYVPPKFTPESAQEMLGNILSFGEDVSDDLVRALIDKIGILQRKEPKTASALREIMMRWRGTAVNSLFMRELHDNRADTSSVIKLLSVRKELKEKQPNEVYEMRNGNSTALGISACIIEDNNEYDGILMGDNADAKAAMFACARLIRADLPIDKVAVNLKSTNKTLALAAERYIESVDTPEARQIILSLYPNKAKILGARNFFSYGDAPIVDFLDQLFDSVNADVTGLYGSYESYEKVEEHLQKELTDDPNLIGAYSLEGNFVRVYKDKTVFSWEEDAARYRERTLKRSEFQRLLDYVINEKLNDLPPFIGDYCGGEHEEAGICDEAEFVMVTRDGGRRIFVNNQKNKTKFLTDLREMFADFRKPPAKLKYWLEKSVTGLEVLFADDKLKAKTLWKTGEDFRLLIEDSERAKQRDDELEKFDREAYNGENVDYEKVEKMRQERVRQHEYEEFSWRKFEQKQLSDVTSQPVGIEYIPKRDNIEPASTQEQWKTRAGNIELRADESGLYKIANGAKTRIRTGQYSSPIISANGHWAMVNKMVNYYPTPFRVNLLTNKEFKVAIPSQNLYWQTFGYLPTLNKFLVGQQYYGDEYADEASANDINRADSNSYMYLVDAETGAVQKVTGEVRPISQQTYRSLQPTGKPDEFWAAIPSEKKEETQIGVYNAKTLAFKSLLTIPQIQFGSMETWVDEKDAKIYFVYEGHLLSLPLPKQP
jgi:HEAT repeat protein